VKMDFVVWQGACILHSSQFSSFFSQLACFNLAVFLLTSVSSGSSQQLRRVKWARQIRVVWWREGEKPTDAALPLETNQDPRALIVSCSHAQQWDPVERNSGGKEFEASLLLESVPEYKGVDKCGRLPLFQTECVSPQWTACDCEAADPR
jgi:hypothetical protein